MKCQILFSRKNKKNILEYHLLKYLPNMQSVKWAQRKKTLTSAVIGVSLHVHATLDGFGLHCLLVISRSWSDLEDTESSSGPV